MNYLDQLQKTQIELNKIVNLNRLTLTQKEAIKFSLKLINKEIKNIKLLENND